MHESIILPSDPYVSLRDLAMAIVIASLSESVSIFRCRRSDCSDFEMSRLPKGSSVSAPSLWFLELEEPNDPALEVFEKRVIAAGCQSRNLWIEGRSTVYLASIEVSKRLQELYGDDWQHSQNAVRLMAIGTLLAVGVQLPQLESFLLDLAFLEDVGRWSDHLADLSLKSYRLTLDGNSDEAWTAFVQNALNMRLPIAS